jgi:dihydroxyacetone kinase
VNSSPKYSEYDLARCADLCRKVNQYGRSMGMALTSCTVPAAGKPAFREGSQPAVEPGKSAATGSRRIGYGVG